MSEKVQNSYTGEVAVNIGGKPYKLLFDWAAIAKLHTKFGAENMEGLVRQSNISDLAEIVAIGLERHHPEMSADDVMKASPAILEVQASLDWALSVAYLGAEVAEKVKDSIQKAAQPEDDEKKQNPAE